MIRVRGRYTNQTIQLDEPLNLPDNAEIEVQVHVPEDTLEGEWAHLLSSTVEVRGVAEVRSYLDRHAAMFEVVEHICKAARREFGPEASLTLQVYRDPEIEDEYLLLRVRLRSYPPDTMPRIRSISDPYEDELRDKSGSIIVTSDFGPVG